MGEALSPTEKRAAREIIRGDGAKTTSPHGWPPRAAAGLQRLACIVLCDAQI
jgi:hypothetical protein